jgi:maleylacetate reductase
MSDEPSGGGFSYTRRAVRVVFGGGAVGAVGAELARAGLRRPFFLSTPGRRAVVDRLVASLAGGAAGLYARAVLHVPAPVVSEALAEVERAGAGSLVAIGGGSAIGLAKAIAHETGLAIVAVPTTYSGSEMTEIWGITDERGKRTARDPRVAPAVVLYDPELTTALSPAASATSGLNAAAHAVEALYAPDANPIASLAAAEALRGLARSLPTVVRQPEDLDARTSALQAAHLAGVALDLASMGLHHKLAHVLGGSFLLPHAETHAVLLPHVVAFNEPAAPGAMRVVAGAFGSATAADGVRDFARALGVVYGLRDLGLAAADLDRAAELATAAPYPNPRPVTPDAVRQVLDAAF